MAPPISDEDVRSDDTATNEAFQLLSDETRVSILHALGEAAREPAVSPVPFSTLRERLDADDPGRLNYHLNKLTTHFVRRTEDGYELREAGKRILRVLRSGTAIDDPQIDPVPVDVACWYCGGQPEWSYRDGWRTLECTNCDARCVESFPPGVISRNEFPPSGLLDRTPNEINDADRIWSTHRRAAVMDDVCPECAGDMPITGIEVCDDHHPDWEDYQFCDHCGSLFWMLVSLVCEVCAYRWRLPTRFYPARHPAVVAFFYEHGIEFDLATHEQRALLLDFEEELVSTDPLEIRLGITLDDETLALTYDDQMDLLDVERRG